MLISLEWDKNGKHTFHEEVLENQGVPTCRYFVDDNNEVHTEWEPEKVTVVRDFCQGVVCFADLIPYEYKVRKFVSYLVPIWTFFGDFTNQNVPCPFHHDNTPSAKLFVDDDKISRLFCYACRQQFTSYDYIKLVLNKNPILYLRERYAEVRLDEQAVYFANNLWGDAPLETGMNWQEIERDVHDMGVVAALNKHYKVEKLNYA